MKKVYKTDDGYEMDENDFLIYLKWLIENPSQHGLSPSETLRFLAEEYWGDSIIDYDWFKVIKRHLSLALLKKNTHEIISNLD